MKKSLSMPNFSLVQKPSTVPKVMKKSASHDILYPLEVLGVETLTHVSLKTAHDCAVSYPTFPNVLIEQSNDANDLSVSSVLNNEKLAICLATPDDTFVPKVAEQSSNQNENRVGEMLVRIRRRLRGNKNRMSVDGQ